MCIRELARQNGKLSAELTKVLQNAKYSVVVDGEYRPDSMSDAGFRHASRSAYYDKCEKCASTDLSKNGTFDPVADATGVIVDYTFRGAVFRCNACQHEHTATGHAVTLSGTVNPDPKPDPDEAVRIASEREFAHADGEPRRFATPTRLIQRTPDEVVQLGDGAQVWRFNQQTPQEAQKTEEAQRFVHEYVCKQMDAHFKTLGERVDVLKRYGWKFYSQPGPVSGFTVRAVRGPVEHTRAHAVLPRAWEALVDFLWNLPGKREEKARQEPDACSGIGGGKWATSNTTPRQDLAEAARMINAATNSMVPAHHFDAVLDNLPIPAALPDTCGQCGRAFTENRRRVFGERLQCICQDCAVANLATFAPIDNVKRIEDMNRDELAGAFGPFTVVERDPEIGNSISGYMPVPVPFDASEPHVGTYLPPVSEIVSEVLPADAADLPDYFERS